MDLVNTRLLPVDRDTAWRALNDPAKLKAAIPGCESMEPAGDGRYTVVVVAAVGPVKARFEGTLTLADVVVPERYALHFEARGGAAGFAKGTANVELTPEEGGTRLAYRVKSQIGGRLAQVGGRLIDAAAKKVAEDFFTAFEAQLAQPSGAPAANAPVKQGSTMRSAILIIVAALLAIAVLALIAR